MQKRGRNLEEHVDEEPNDGEQGRLKKSSFGRKNSLDIVLYAGGFSLSVTQYRKTAIAEPVGLPAFDNGYISRGKEICGAKTSCGKLCSNLPNCKLHSSENRVDTSYLDEEDARYLIPEGARFFVTAEGRCFAFRNLCLTPGCSSSRQEYRYFCNDCLEKRPCCPEFILFGDEISKK